MQETISTSLSHPVDSTLAKLIKQLKPEQRYSYPLPHGSADAYWITQLAQTAQTPIIVMCHSAQDAQRLYDEIALFDKSLRVYQFPDWETLPYDTFSPHHDLISERLKTLHALVNQTVDVITIPVTTALNRLAPVEFLAKYSFSFKQKDTLNEHALLAQLTLANYTHVSQVTAPGEFCIRGGLIDLFPMGSVLPYRIDLFDDVIESIRAFDIDTQRSIYTVNHVMLLPGREFPMDESARNDFRARFRELFDGDPSRALPYKDIGSGIAFQGVEYYLPLFFENTATIFDYLPKDSIVVTRGDLEQSIHDFFEDTHQRYEFLKADRERPVLGPYQIYQPHDEFFTRLKAFRRLHFDSNKTHESLQALPDVQVLRSDRPFERLINLIETAPVVLCASSEGRAEVLHQMLLEQGISLTRLSDWETFVQSNITNGVLIACGIQSGFRLTHGDTTYVITEDDLYPGYSAQRQRVKRHKASNVELMIRDLSELKMGDPIVHAQHGIGRYLGLINMDLGTGDAEFLHIEYSNETKLYVPVAQLHLISRYSGTDPDQAPLHTLGSGQWEKARSKAAQKARDTAAELLNLYARREMRQGFEFKLPLSDYNAFAESFGFEETADQAAAIQAVLQDMTSGRPMDRLVCGDVGFGKTEVALRAAFIAVANNKQVALLCPTTLLAEQHTQNFIDRFASWPVNIVELSRFKTAKETKQAIERINKGEIDIVIGTHKILSKDIAFERLGLVIIDEEHRFGVRQKEALKELRSEVDVLTLTATPIPRTLGMSMEGIRDFSVIATAPQKRLAIKTFVRREDSSTIREALLRELKRGGQVYFLHNEVDTIHNRREMLEKLVPEARIGIAHGQMPERELEQVMKNFYQQRYNVLLCTTIIETGIDVPNANTIVMHRADKFGLAQLHQLRGRVGRSHHQAYAYLLTPGEDAITNQAKKRLEAIQSMEELGSGFYLAMHDLEIRGAGEILGDTQSGNIQDVGFQMYSDMLNQAVAALRQGKEPDLMAPLAATIEINLHTSALLPHEYCPDINARLSIYKRLASSTHLDDILLLKEEIIDRFGKLPDAALALIETHKLRLEAQTMGIQKIDASDIAIVLSFVANPPIDPYKIIQLVQQNKHIKMLTMDRLRMDVETLDLTSRIHRIRSFIQSLK